MEIFTSSRSSDSITPGFGKSAKAPRRFSKFALRCLNIRLYHVFSRCLSGIFYLHLYLTSKILADGKINARIAECRIRKPITNGYSTSSFAAVSKYR